MKLTKQQLKQIIKEELEKVLGEQYFSPIHGSGTSSGSNQETWMKTDAEIERENAPNPEDVKRDAAYAKKMRQKKFADQSAEIASSKAKSEKEAKIQRHYDRVKNSIIKMNPVGNLNMDENEFGNFMNQLENVLNFYKNRKQNGALKDYGVFKSDDAKYALDNIARYKKSYDDQDIMVLLRDYVGREDVGKRTFMKKAGSFLRGKGFKEE
tara:strand:- start:688 stop:1317 length:630 start_codon:yes stop_codon:yes gene_type:complete